VELDHSATSRGTANFLDGPKKLATHSSGPPNYLDTDDVTAGHVTLGNGQYFVLDSEAVNRETFMSSRHRDVLQ